LLFAAPHQRSVHPAQAKARPSGSQLQAQGSYAPESLWSCRFIHAPVLHPRARVERRRYRMSKVPLGEGGREGKSKTPRMSFSNVVNNSWASQAARSIHLQPVQYSISTIGKPGSGPDERLTHGSCLGPTRNGRKVEALAILAADKGRGAENTNALQQCRSVAGRSSTQRRMPCLGDRDIATTPWTAFSPPPLKAGV
jgi:hypothetical protein